MMRSMKLMSAYNYVYQNSTNLILCPRFLPEEKFPDFFLLEKITGEHDPLACHTGEYFFLSDPAIPSEMQLNSLTAVFSSNH